MQDLALRLLKKGEMLSDICIYATACGHAGIGGGINAAITYSETKSLPTSGVSNSVGVTVGGGVGGAFCVYLCSGC